MDPGRFRFGAFLLDPADRRLTCEGAAVDLNARYLDALALLVKRAGSLVTKDQFLDQVWRGIPVTDEALTQCIRTLRRQLGDDAAHPRFIETVPKHGYRFIAPVERVERVEQPIEAPSQSHAAPVLAPAPSRLRPFLLLGGAGTLGAGIAGLIGGIFYGFIGATQPFAPGMGAASVLLVLLWVTIATALVGGAGVSFGIAAATFAPRTPSLAILGGALGGLIVGAIVKLLGVDAFDLLLGHSPGDITGAGEGLLLGASVGVGSWLAIRRAPPLSLRRAILVAALVSGATGAAITALGGRLMGGSLDLLARSFPSSRLRLSLPGGMLGEPDFGPVSQIVTGTIEAMLFGGCIVAALVIARRSIARGGDSHAPATPSPK